MALKAGALSRASWADQLRRRGRRPAGAALPALPSAKSKQTPTPYNANGANYLHIYVLETLLVGKFAWGNKTKHYWALPTNFWNKKFFDIILQCFALLPQVNFPTNNLNFHWMWWNWIQAIFLNLFYFTFMFFCDLKKNLILLACEIFSG